MRHIGMNALSRAAVLLLCIALLPAGGTAAWAHDKKSGERKSTISTQSRTVNPSLNLLGEPRPGARTVRVRAMGNGSYVCSPAGLGRGSRCYRN